MIFEPHTTVKTRKATAPCSGLQRHCDLAICPARCVRSARAKKSSGPAKAVAERIEASTRARAVRELEQLRRIANQVGVVTFAAAGDVSRKTGMASSMETGRNL